MLIEQEIINEAVRVKSFISDNCPNRAIIHGVLEGKIKGKLFLNTKKTACLITTESSFNFIAGDIDDNFLKASLNHTPKTEGAFLVNCNNSYCFPKNLPLKIRVLYEGEACDIQDVPKEFADYIKNNFTLEMINETLFDRCAWKEKLLAFYGSKENFLKHGYGGLLLEGSQVVGELYGIIGGNTLEIGCFTTEKYRGHRFGPFITANSLKQYCDKRKLFITVGSEKANVSSERSVMHLGLKKVPEYYVLDLEKLNTDNISIPAALDNRVGA